MSGPKCANCEEEMKPLLTTFFCPNDCDRDPVAGLRKAGKVPPDFGTLDLTPTFIAPAVHTGTSAQSGQPAWAKAVGRCSCKVFMSLHGYCLNCGRKIPP